MSAEVSFTLADSALCSIWTERPEQVLTGTLLLTYDTLAVVRVDGWRWAHTVPQAKLRPAEVSATDEQQSDVTR